MAIRNEKLGGVDYVNGEVLYDYDLDDTNNQLINMMAVGITQNAYQTLQANNVFENKDYLATDEFADADGTNDTVNISSTTSFYDIANNYYVIGGATGSDVDNDSTGQTYATTNSSTPATGIEILMTDTRALTRVTKSSTCTATRCYIVIDGENYYANFSGDIADFSSQNIRLTNGAVYEILCDSNGSTFTRHYDATPNLISTTSWDVTGGAGGTYTMNVTYIETDSIETSSEVICDTNTLTLTGDEKSICVYADKSNDVYTGTGDGTDDTSIITKTPYEVSNGNTGGVKIFSKDNLLIQKVRVPYYNATINNSILSILDKNKNSIKTSSSNILTTGTGDGTDDTSTITPNTIVSNSATNLRGINFIADESCFLKSVTKESLCTASKAYLVRDNIIISEASFSGDTATFSTLTSQFIEKDGIYAILCGTDGSTYTSRNTTDYTISLASDLSELSDVGVTADYVDSSKTLDLDINRTNFDNVISFVTQTSSTESTRYIDSIDIILNSGQEYYLVEDISSHIDANQWITGYSKTYPQAGTYFNIKGGIIDNTDTSIFFKSCFEIITQNITGSLTPVTNTTADISDGTTTLSAQPLNEAVNVSTLSSGTLEITFNLTTTDANITPYIKGYGIFIK